MTTLIGRCGTDDVTLDEPSTWAEGPDGTVQAEGWIADLTTLQAGIVRDQFLGLINPDEPIVPVFIDHDDTRNGLYRVLDADVDHVLGATEITGDRKWKVALQRTRWWDQPRYELKRSGGVVSNVHSITTSSYTSFIGLPASAEAVDSGTDTGTLVRGTRASA